MPSIVYFTITISTVLLMFSNFVPQGGCCDAFERPIGNMTPDHEVLVGKDLILNCHLFENKYYSEKDNSTSYVNSSSLLFKFNKKQINDVKIIDNLTLQLRIQNASEENSGLYFCFLSIPQRKKKLVCVGTYKVGYAPLPAENFTCLSDKLQTLSCKWDAPANNVKTSYKLYDNIFGKNLCNFHPSFDRPCPQHTAAVGNNSCEWSLETHPVYLVQREKLCFQLVGQNSLGTNVQKFTLDHYALVKAGEPQKLTVHNHTSNSFVASWLPPKYMGRRDEFPPGLTYEAQYKPDYSESWQVKALNNETFLTIPGLIPYTNYKLQVRCRSAVAVSDETWSKFATDSVRTDQDVPYLAPEVTIGLFKTRDLGNRRNITLYWKGVSSKHWNGEGFKYIITYTESHLQRQRRSVNHEIVINGNESLAVFTGRNVHSSYEFVLYPANNVGKSKNFSIIKVPRKEDAPKSPKDITVIYDKGHYNVSWENPSQETDNIINYTVYWCKMLEPNPFTCKGAIKWESVSAEVKAVTVEMEDEESFLQFAVSANTNHLSSGLEWAPCVVAKDGVLNRVNTVVLQPLGPNSLKVDWNLDCPVRKHLVQEYIISYCEVNENKMCSGETKNITITDKQTTSYIINELKAFTLYRVHVIATTRKGSSEESIPQFERTKPGAPSDPPRHLSILQKTNTTIEITWQPPLQTHGNITDYTVSIMKGEIDVQKAKKVDPSKPKLSAKFEQLTPFTNYTLQVVACVQYSCSPPNLVDVTTDIGVPGIMEGPMLKEQNETFVQVSWVAPSEPNGPVDFYVLHIQWENDDESQTEAINVSGASHYDLSVTCPTDEKVMLYFFSIQAVNIKDGEILYGNRSNPMQSRLCFNNKGMEFGLIIGITVGGAVVLAVIIVALYFIIRWMKKEVDIIKGTEINLPHGLESPYDPLSSYESFKNGLKRKPNESNLSPKTFYGRLNSYASDESDPKDRTDPGMSPFGNNSREELLHNAKDRSENKSNTGSTNTGKGNDSISSSLTTRTQLSSDSGAETDVQAPPSPESDSVPLCPPHTSPQPNKSSLPKVNEAHSCDSKDSGLEKEEGVSEKETDVSDPNRYTKFVPYNAGHPYNRRPALHKGGTVSQQLPYSKFGVNISGYVPLSTTLALMPRSLANSEPSVVDADAVNKDNPDLYNTTTSLAPPYSKYGIGRSLGQSLNLPGLNESDNLGTGYSKCGIGPNMTWMQQPKSPYIAADLASLLLGKDTAEQNKQLTPTANEVGLTENSKTASPLPPAPFCSSPSRNNGYVTVDSMNKPSSFLTNQQANGPVCLPSEGNRTAHSKGYVSVQDANKMLNEDRKLPKISETKDQAAGIPGYSKFDIQCDRLQNTPDIQMPDPVLTGTKPKAYVNGIHQGYVSCNDPTFDVSPISVPFNGDGSYAVNGNVNGDLSPPPSELNLESENSEYAFDTDNHSPSKYLPQSKVVKPPTELNNGYVRVKADSSLDGIRILPTDSQLCSSLTDTAV